ncbi:hypothetical protein [Metabacillus lacus]|nr:hypothetical protein [Metabacillus lacus]
MTDKKVYQPKDTGKLTNIHYGSPEKDDRLEKALTEQGTEKLK